MWRPPDEIAFLNELHIIIKERFFLVPFPRGPGLNVTDMLSVITIPVSQWPSIFFTMIESFVCVEFGLNYHFK